MLTEEKTIPTEQEMSESTDDAFLDGLFGGGDALDDMDWKESAADTDDAADTEDESFNGAETEIESEAENGEEVTEPEAGDTNRMTEEELIDLVYNGQTTSLPRSEIIKLAQKGMNYDHVKGQLDGLKNSDTQRKLTQLANDAGMTPDQYLDSVLGNRDERRVQELADTEGISPEIAKRLITAEGKVGQYEAAEAERGEKEQQSKMIDAFIQAYPDVKATDIPPEVWEQAHKTNDLIGAYAAHENKLLKERASKAEAALEQFKKNESNKQKAVGSVRGSKAAAVEDPFLSGLLGN